MARRKWWRVEEGGELEDRARGGADSAQGAEASAGARAARRSDGPARRAVQDKGALEQSRSVNPRTRCRPPHALQRGDTSRRRGCSTVLVPGMTGDSAIEVAVRSRCAGRHD